MPRRRRTVAMKINSLRELFISQLREAADVEGQLERALPKMLQHASHAELKDAIHLHLGQTKEQARRIDRCFELLREEVKTESSDGIKGIVKGGEHLMDREGDPAAIDAGIIASAQKAEHYEIALYGTLCSYAEMLGEQECLALLKQTLSEEKETDAKLTNLAERVINVHAMKGGEQTRHA